MPTIHYLKEEEVIFFNKKLVEFSRDPHSEINPANLSSKIEMMQLKYEHLPTFEEKMLWKAAFWLKNMVHSGHAFVEGNKRTAILSTLVFLSMNGFFFRSQNPKSQNNIVTFVKAVAEGKHTLSSVKKWLSASTMSVTEHDIDGILSEAEAEMSKLKNLVRSRCSYSPKRRYEKPLRQLQLRLFLLDARTSSIRALQIFFKK